MEPCVNACVSACDRIRLRIRMRSMHACALRNACESMLSQAIALALTHETMRMLMRQHSLARINWAETQGPVKNVNTDNGRVSSNFEFYNLSPTRNKILDLRPRVLKKIRIRITKYFPRTPTSIILAHLKNKKFSETQGPAKNTNSDN